MRNSSEGDHSTFSYGTSISKLLGGGGRGWSRVSVTGTGSRFLGLFLCCTLGKNNIHGQSLSIPSLVVTHHERNSHMNVKIVIYNVIMLICTNMGGGGVIHVL